MGPKNIERNIGVLEGFMQLWKKFHDVLDAVLRDRKATDEIEERFLELKTEIAHKQALLSEILGLESRFTDDVMGILSQIISLKDYLTLSSTQVKRIESQWHNLFILMHGQLGKYEAYSGKKGGGWLLRGLRSPWIILIGVVSVLLLIYYLGQEYFRR